MRDESLSNWTESVSFSSLQQLFVLIEDWKLSFSSYVKGQQIALAIFLWVFSPIAFITKLNNQRVWF